MTEITVPAARTLAPAEIEAVSAMIMSAHSPATTRAYEAAWRLFAQWATGLGRCPLPADPLHVASYLTQLADSRAHSTVAKHAAAIGWMHGRRGHIDPVMSQGVRQVMAGLRRVHGVAPARQAHPLSLAELRRIVSTTIDDGPAGVRDRALLLIGWGAALRVSELVALRAVDVVISSDALVVNIARSKTDREGRGAHVAVRRGEHEVTDPVAALLAWFELTGANAADRAGQPLWLRLDRAGKPRSGAPLGARTIGDMLRRRAERCGLGDLDLSSHSLRAGHVTHRAVHLRHTLEEIARSTRHASIETTRGYVRVHEAALHAADLGL